MALASYGTGLLVLFQSVISLLTVSAQFVSPPATMRNPPCISVIGVYLPCSYQGSECYRQHLVELERIVSESALLGPVIILGDFNAHLGSLGGPRGRGPANVHGVLLENLWADALL